MMQKHQSTTIMNNNSILRRVSRFEQQQQQQNHAKDGVGFAGSNNAQQSQQSHRQQSLNSEKDLTIIQTAAALAAVNHRHNNHHNNSHSPTTTVPSLSQSSSSSSLLLPNNEEQSTTEASSNENNSFIIAAFERFKQEFASLYPDHSGLPFDEQLHSIEQAKLLLQLQKERIKELNKQLNQTKFATKFLEEIITHDDKESSSSGSILLNNIENDSKNENSETNDKLNNGNNDSIVSSASATTPSKEQYVTVITLNDSAYGEIQKISPSTTTTKTKQQPPPPSRSSSIAENNNFNKNHKDADDDSDDDIDDKSDDIDLNNKKETINKMNKNKEENKKYSSSKPEPIYSNTLETQQKSNNTAQEKASKKRPPTPPRKPKLPNKFNNNVDNSNASSFVGIPLTKSESYSNSSRSQCQRKFNGPLQQVGIQEKQMQSKSMKDVSSSPSKPFLRTFSLEPNNNSDAIKVQQPQDNQIDKKSLDESIISNDDNIYDTVAPDSDDEFKQQQQQQLLINNNSNDEENETSSQEMLSRSSSIDELSNYVNIDYFLRKNSLGRSNSNIPAKLNCKNNKSSNSNVEESDDNEANMSSIKSSDCDNQFGSSDNILRSFQNAPSQHSIRSFNSISSTNSSGGSSLRIRNPKMLNNSVETYHHHHHPASNLSTFTPPIREKNHQEFIFKDQSSIDEKDESSIYSDGSDFNLLESNTNNINNSLKNTSTVMMDSKSSSSDYNLELSSSTDYYAYADIYDASNLMMNVSKDERKMPSLDIQDESMCMEDKSICKYDTSTLDNTDQIDGQQNQIENNKKLISNIKAQQSSTESEHSLQMQWNIVRTIIDSETIYLDCLNTLNKYKKAFETASKGENALLSMEDLNTIFYRIPELFDLHNTFLNGLKTVEHGFKLRHSSMTADSKLASKLITKQSIGELFNKLAEKLSVYSDFLRNYSKAIETANRCGANNARFYDIIKSIKIASAHGQFSNLVDLLYEPIARLQKNDLVLHDLLKYSENEDEQILLKNASRLNQKFLNDLNLDAARKLFMTHDKFKRRLVKESFIIESGDRRKLRHLFLFNDVIVSAKYKASSKQKFTFELRWFQMLNDIVLDSSTSNQLNLNRSQSPVSSSIGAGGYISVGPQQQNSNSMNSQMINSRESDKESKECQNTTNLISNLKSRAFLTRIDLFLEEKRKGHSKQSDRLRKKISELESELLLLLPQLRFSFHVKNNPHKSYVFFMSSEYERNCWIDAIKTLQQNASSDEHANVQVLQKWIESCRKSINVNLGSFLLRTNKDETLRYGDLHIRIIHLDNFNFQTNLFIVIETDSFGHYFKRAVARYLTTDSNNKHQDFLIELEGSQILRFLLYEDCKNNNKTNCDNQNENEKSLILKGKASLELSSSCASSEPRLTEIQIGEHTLCFETRYISWNSIMEMIPPNKIYGAFGVNIGQVCKKEKSKVPYLILSCINEVERRGLKEVGIYRVSGLSSEVQKLRKAFETNPREACYLIREIDIHSVTGLLKLYLRELPESLFTNEMLKKFFEARDSKNHEEKELKMTTLLSQLIEPNQTTVIKMIEHLVLVNRYEEDNKMSLNNLATVFGPTMLRTPSNNNSNNGGKSNSISSSSSSGNNNNSSIQNFQSGNINANIASLMINTDLFTAGTIDVMAQADILYFFLRRKSDGLSLISVDHQEETSL